MGKDYEIIIKDENGLTVYNDIIPKEYITVDNEGKIILKTENIYFSSNHLSKINKNEKVLNLTNNEDLEIIRDFIKNKGWFK